MKLNNFLCEVFSGIFVFVFIFVATAIAADKYVIDEKNSNLNCLIRYTLIGKYEPVFEKFEGSINFDEKNLTNSSIDISIKIASLKSKYPVLDRIACSNRFMDAAKYPVANFKSNRIKKGSKEKEYLIDGVMNFHGVEKDVAFEVFINKHQENSVELTQKEYIIVDGKLTVNRKDFGIAWSKIFDKKGIIVSEQVVISWQVTAKKEDE